jgi:DNA-binding FadR family transcriptional regulator
MREMMMARLAQMNLVRKRHGAGPVVHRHPEDPDGVCDGLHSTIPDPKNPGAYIDIGGG